MGNRRYNCTTNGTIKEIDPETDTKARRLIDSCFHLTPDTTADLDNLIGIGTTETTNKPKRLDMITEDHGKWDDDDLDESHGPTDAELMAGQRRGE